MSNDWNALPFTEALTDVTAKANKVDQSLFQNSGKLPIVDQSQNFIAGYIDDDSLVWKEELPVIIFGDHTRAVKYVDFPFVLGADGTKVLRPRPDIFPKFAYFELLHIEIPSAGYSRHFKFLKEREFAYPPLPEQQRIAAILDRADRLRRTRRYAAQLSDSFLQAVFMEMFGDPARNEKGWDVCELQELIRDGDTINYGVVQPGDDVPNGAPIIRVGDLDNLSFTTANLKRIDPAIEATYKRSRLVGDEVLIACVGSIGKIALAHEGLKGFNIVRAVARVPVNGSLNRLFLATYLSTKYIQDYFKQETRTVSQPTLNILQIQETRVILPPFALQEKFAHIVQQFDRLRARQREAERQAEHLFQALLHRAFAGE